MKERRATEHESRGRIRTTSYLTLCFPALPTAQFVKVQMLPKDDAQKEAEAQKKKKQIEARAKAKLAEAALPPRMQQHEIQRKKLEKSGSAADLTGSAGAGGAVPSVIAANVKVPELLGSSIRKKSKAAQGITHLSLFFPLFARL